MKKRTFAIHAAVPARLPNPKTAAIIAIIKNVIAHDKNPILFYSLFFIKIFPFISSEVFSF